jgi:1-acyl-sn-glycerol-3-phosphate acyltransferase
MESRVAMPSHDAIAAGLRWLEPWRLLTAPWLGGLEHVPATGPMLLAGNHTIMGLYDAPMLFAELFHRRGLVVRGLGDHAHFAVPGWRDLLSYFGVVDGTPENCTRLLEAGESVLVFPGGGREVAKRRGEKYRLIWKDRLGFVRLAAQVGCPIVPVAAVGAEEAWDIVFDADDILAGPLGPIVTALSPRQDIVFPVVRGVGPTPLPRPVRLYVRFGAPVPTAGTAPDDVAACRRIRDAVGASIEDGIRYLHAIRDLDPERDLLPRLRAQAGRLLRGR